MKNNCRIGFAGFGEVNTPKDIIVRKCAAALAALQAEDGVEIGAQVFPITDDYPGHDVTAAVNELKKGDFDALVLCIAGWIPTHAVITVAEQFKHLPVVLWGLCGWIEDDGRLVTTADQAGTTALRGTLEALGYTFEYVYDIIGQKTNSRKVADFCTAASAAKRLRSAKLGTMGYRDMRLYGTLCDENQLKRDVGVEIDCFEMLEVVRRAEKVSTADIEQVIEYMKANWHFTAAPSEDALHKTAKWYLAISEICRERNYSGVTLKDVDGMKLLLSFPPAPIFMLLSDRDGLCTVPENDCPGGATQIMLRELTQQCGGYLEFYEFMEDRVLAGVPDFIPAEITEGQTTITPAAFGELSQGLLNVSKVKPGELTMCRLGMKNGKLVLHLLKGEGVPCRRWEEAGWTQPAPQLPALEILLPDVPAFAEKVLGQHYFIAYGDHTTKIKAFCKIQGIEII